MTALLVFAVAASVVIGAVAVLARPPGVPDTAQLAAPSLPAAIALTPEPSPAPASPATTDVLTPQPSLAPTPSAPAGTPPASPTPSSASLAPTPSQGAIASPVPAPSPTPFVYTVVRGDTLIAICRTFRCNVHELVKVNHIKTPSLIITGQQLVIPTNPSNYP